MSRRCQASSVSGVTIVANCSRTFRPNFRPDRQLSALLVTETESPSAELLPEHAVFFAQVLDHAQLFLIHPASNCNQQESERIQTFRHVGSKHYHGLRPGAPNRFALSQIRFSDHTGSGFPVACLFRKFGLTPDSPRLCVFENELWNVSAAERSQLNRSFGGGARDLCFIVRLVAACLLRSRSGFGYPHLYFWLAARV